jgi:hypothetical protein
MTTAALPSVTVTPSSPLNISGATAGYDVVTLAGGVITITANVTFPITKLIQQG